MKNATLFLAIIFCCGITWGQSVQKTIKFPVRDKQVIIDAQEATLNVEGYDGNDLVIESESLGNIVNTAVPNGYQLLESGSREGDDFIHYEILKDEPSLFSIRLRSVYNKAIEFRHFHVKVPKNTHLKVVFIIAQLGAKMSFKNLNNELEVEGTAPFIQFDNITGPLTLSEGVVGHRNGGTEKVVISHLDVSKAKVKQEGVPLFNIVTTYGDVDISLPKDTKVTIQVDAARGRLFTDLDLLQQPPAYPMVKNRYTGNLNGGGKMLVINAGYGNVYLRKQK